mmetsp:Transcript_68107/g.215476  ORF Transcript_68107/g.215476 Transcript_68107/m.215476 type:complete len:414 (-) Transcript_68107:74-1315(-)
MVALAVALLLCLVPRPSDGKPRPPSIHVPQEDLSHLHLRGSHREDGWVKGDTVEGVKASVILFRHGDRTPTDAYTFEEYNWQGGEGLGQLTPLGLKQSFDLGVTLRERLKGSMSHHDFSDIERHHDLHVRSTDYDRTVDTATSVVLGLLSGAEPKPLEEIQARCGCRLGDEANGEGGRGSTGRNWARSPQPCLEVCFDAGFPESKMPKIYTLPQNQDYLLLQRKARGCPAPTHRAPQSLPPPVVAALDKMKKSVGTTICNKQRDGRAEHCRELGLQDIESVWAGLKVNTIHEKPWPGDWHAAETLLEDTKPAVMWYWRHMMAPKEDGKQLGGVLLGEVARILTLRAEIAEGAPRASRQAALLTLLSAHDVTLLGVMAAMGVEVDQIDLPGYSSWIAFDLRRAAGGECVIYPEP